MWRDTLTSMRRNWFTAATKPLLVAFCRHTALRDKLSDDLYALSPVDAQFGRVYRMFRAETAIVVRLRLRTRTGRASRARAKSAGSNLGSDDAWHAPTSPSRLTISYGLVEEKRRNLEAK